MPHPQPDPQPPAGDRPRTVTLGGPPSLAPLLARGALLSPLKKAGPGAVAPPTRIVLPGARADAGRLAAYEEICGFAPDRAALPVTYPHLLGFPLQMLLMSERAFPLPLLGLVHTSISIEQHRALHPLAESEVTVYADQFAPHRRGTEAHLVTEARVDGALVWESRSTYLARHAVPAEQRERADAPQADAPDPLKLPEAAEWRLPGDLGRRYGAASGDRNPIHLHPLTARLFGFPRAIAHGMWTVARCLAAQGATGPVRVRAEFKAPVLLPATVTYAAEGGDFALRSGERVHLTGRVGALG
ncbi:MaoC/PaaZ C-terminal domain-containing protein [Streptomyces physcomitrii]|uniref:MaoC-like domain-containing protein n=1 Tax=Streptomyces physcomitrii TaxID=2724184 RepID=A0ABX1H7P3_9ACTN|nr:MaoC/PaaZ C-terminal domain-containing protein [Streptomyces physcomitrii]NKI44357.1 hypothetical protein [Streptomyces physcomitrii]